MRIALAIVAIVIILLLVFAAYMGMFRRVQIAVSSQGPFTFVYRSMSGTNMSQVRQITTELSEVLREVGVTDARPLDVFYPDGAAQIGFAVGDLTDEQTAALNSKASVREIPEQECITARFPWRNPLSFIVGYLKVDPALARHRAANSYRKVEAMALNEGPTILYMQPIVAEA